MKLASDKRLFLFILFGATGIAFLAMPMIGMKMIFPGDFLEISGGTSQEYTIFWKMRLPRVIMAFLSGAILAISGMVFQAIFRNPLVSPFTLGVSAGASLGASIYIWFGLSFTYFSFPGISLFSFLGAGLSTSIIWLLANMKRKMSVTILLLAGVAISFSFASFIMFIQYVSDMNESVRITRWLMGGLVVFGYKSILSIAPLAIGGGVLVLYFSRELNLFAVGEEFAIGRGVDTSKTIKILFFGISAMVGGVVSVCGPIAFIGIITPHVCRCMTGPDHRYLAPCTFLFGGIFLMICDAFARTIAAPAEIPVGVITALLGGPFFLWILIRRPQVSDHWI